MFLRLLSISFVIFFSLNTLSQNNSKSNDLPFEVTLWVEHPFLDVADSIYVGLDLEGTEGYDSTLEEIDTTSIFEKPVNLLLENAEVESLHPTSCVGNLRREVKYLDTTSNLFEVSFDAWFVSDTIDLSGFAELCDRGSAWLKWDFKSLNFDIGQEYILANFQVSTQGGYVCFVDNTISWIMHYSDEMLDSYMDSVSILSEDWLPFGCFDDSQGTLITFKFTFYKQSWLDWLGVVDEAQEQNELDIYPNPSNGLTTVYSNLPLSEFRLFNNMGQMVLHDYVDEDGTKVLDLTHLRQGVYHIVFNQNPTVVRKIIIQ